MNSAPLSLSAWKQNLAALSDPVLLENTARCVASEREKVSWLVAHLAEVYRRDLALKRGYGSLFKYARFELGLSDSQSWERVSAAQLALQLPDTIEKLASGELTLASAGELWKTIRELEKAPAPSVKKAEELAPPLPLGDLEKLKTPDPPKPLCLVEKRDLMTQVLGKTRRETEATLQEWKAKREGKTSAPAQPKRTCLSFQLTDEELNEWNRLRDLISHRVGSMDPEKAFRWMLEHSLEKVDPVRIERRIQQRNAQRCKASRKSKARDLSQTNGVNVVSEENVVSAAGIGCESNNEMSPEKTQIEAGVTEVCVEEVSGAETEVSSATVHTVPNGDDATRRAEQSPIRKSLPAALRRKIWIRDQGICQFEDSQSKRRCGSTAFMDIDHTQPLAEGGSDEESNLRLVCANHNRRRHEWSR